MSAVTATADATDSATASAANKTWIFERKMAMKTLEAHWQFVCFPSVSDPLLPIFY